MTIRLSKICQMRYLHRSFHVGRIVPEVDPDLSERIADKTVNLKKIRTRRNLGLVRLPAQLEMAAETRIRNSSDRNFRDEVKRLIDIMYRFKVPDDRHTLKLKKADIKTELEIRDKIRNRSDYEPDEFKLSEEYDIAKFELSKLIEGTLEDRRRDWHYYEYDEYASDLYMATRLAPNYASIKSVMNEIRDLVPEFEPRSVLDFGSGLGTTAWAVNETWPNSTEELMNVDLSKEQQYLCDYLLRGGKELGHSPPGIFHRQYLPSSSKVKYDMVVSAFTMLELPNAELRANTIENLWNKTKDFLVIIERGNRSGFSIIKEARNFVLDITGHNVTRKVHLSPVAKLKIGEKPPESHVLAPCSHEFLCPKTAMPTKNNLDLCRYPFVFEPLELGESKSGFVKDYFSYVVIRKGTYPDYFDGSRCRWPRAVDKRLRSHHQITHKLCCPNGALAETVITKKKYGNEAYELAKACNWGDIVPIKVHDTYVKRSSFIDESHS